MQDFSVEGLRQMFGGSDFSRVERNFTIGQSAKTWGNFSKNCIKINKYFFAKLLGKFEKNANFSENCLKFSGRE